MKEGMSKILTVNTMCHLPLYDISHNSCHELREFIGMGVKDDIRG